MKASMFKLLGLKFEAKKEVLNKDLVHHTYKTYKAPDGTIGSLKWFYQEARNGRLHGLTIK